MKADAKSRGRAIFLIVWLSGIALSAYFAGQGYEHKPLILWLGTLGSAAVAWFVAWLVTGERDPN